MNIFMTVLLLSGADFNPCVRIVCHPYHWSGVVVREDPQFYYAVTCNHWSKYTDSRMMRVGLVSGAEYVEVPATVVRQDYLMDLACLRIAKRLEMRITPLDISTDTIPRGDVCEVHGYNLTSKRLRCNSLTYHSNRYLYTENGYTKLLSCKGHGIYGMSGGPLLYDGRVYGVQLHNTEDPLSDTQLTAFMPGSEIQEFLSGL